MINCVSCYNVLKSCDDILIVIFWKIFCLLFIFALKFEQKKSMPGDATTTIKEEKWNKTEQKTEQSIEPRIILITGPECRHLVACIKYN